MLAKQLDAIYPMVYPSHYGAGELGIDDPNANPQQTVALSLQAFRQQLKGSDTRMIPWLQDFSLGRTYKLSDVKAQILAARRMKSQGFLLWNAEGSTRPRLSAATEPRSRFIHSITHRSGELVWKLGVTISLRNLRIFVFGALDAHGALP